MLSQFLLPSGRSGSLVHALLLPVLAKSLEVALISILLVLVIRVKMTFEQAGFHGLIGKRLHHRPHTAAERLLHARLQ